MNNQILTAVNATYGKGMQKEAAAKAGEGTVNLGKRVMDLLNKAKGAAGTVGNAIGGTLADTGKGIGQVAENMGNKVLLNGALTQPGTMRYKLEDILTNGLIRTSEIADKYPKTVGGAAFTGSAGTGAAAGSKVGDWINSWTQSRTNETELPKQASVADILKKAKQQF